VSRSRSRRNYGAPWAGAGPPGDQPDLGPHKSWTERLTPIIGTPTIWGDDLRTGTRAASPPRLVLWAVLWGTGAVVALVLDRPWFALAALIMSAWALVLRRFARIPNWTWIVVLVVVICFVAPLDWVLAAKSPAHVHHRPPGSALARRGPPPRGAARTGRA